MTDTDWPTPLMPSHEMTQVMLALARYIALVKSPVEGSLADQHHHEALVANAHATLLDSYQTWLLHVAE